MVYSAHWTPLVPSPAVAVDFAGNHGEEEEWKFFFNTNGLFKQNIAVKKYHRLLIYTAGWLHWQQAQRLFVIIWDFIVQFSETDMNIASLYDSSPELIIQGAVGVFKHWFVPLSFTVEGKLVLLNYIFISDKTCQHNGMCCSALWWSVEGFPVEYCIFIPLLHWDTFVFILST